MNLRRYFLSVLAVVALLATGCDEDYERFTEQGPVTPTDPVGADQWLLDVNVDGGNATYSTDPFVEGATTAPEVLAARQIVRGGSLVMAVTVDDTADELLVTVRNADFGLYRIDLSALAPEVLARAEDRAQARSEKLAAVGVAPRAAARASREVWVNLTSAPDYTGVGFTVQIATVTDGVTSAARDHVVSVNSTAAASSELQVSLNWVHPVDMDLHVECPDGEVIFFANKEGTLGGELDLDSNPACFLDYVQNENVTWRSVAPMGGEYVVRVDLWSSCEAVDALPYVVTVRRGETVTTYEGNFVPADDQVSPREITRFTVN